MRITTAVGPNQVSTVGQSEPDRSRSPPVEAEPTGWDWVTLAGQRSVAPLCIPLAVSTATRERAFSSLRAPEHDNSDRMAHHGPVLETVCPSCGRPLDFHDRDMRFRLPDPVAATPGWERLPGVWLSHDDPNESIMMQVPEAGPFIRCLLPVRLSGGFTVTFGVWLSVPPEDLQHAFRVWWEPEYRDLVLDGMLANALPVWGLFGSPARARVVHDDETPYIVESSQQDLSRVLNEQWPHDELLAALQS